MKKFIPWILIAIFGVWALSTLRPLKNKTEYDLHGFSEIPVLLNGRIQPMSSAARNSLVVIHGKASVLLEEKPWYAFWSHPPKLTATEWFLEAMSRPADADERKIFRIDHPELRGGMLNLPEEKFFSFNQIKDKWEQLETEARRITRQKREVESRTPFEKAVIKLSFGINTYFRIKNNIRPENANDFEGELSAYQKTLASGVAAFQAHQEGKEYDQTALTLLAQFARRYQVLSNANYALVIPPPNPEKSRENWINTGTALLGGMATGQVDPAIQHYAKMVTAYGDKKPAEFNKAVADYRGFLSRQYQPELNKGYRETYFNDWRPFVKSMAIYIVAFIAGCGFWFNWNSGWRLTAMGLGIIALIVHTGGLIFRMVLEGRPPVTNLYSSAIFVGWGAVILGLILERIYKDGIGVVAASAVGFTTLVIAHNLSLDGDTMEMLRAVLDTNFWLATHVVVITLGYSAMFVAGLLAIIYILRGFFTTTLPSASAKALSRMVYGIICFSTLFSFVGTVLGGIWADQSWGRFWGWDPKENGALMIVIWCAVILHARWGGLIKDRGLMAMAVFGNVVTAFSWFGVNMLGVGLHSYGFMEQAFKWLMGFNMTQVAIIALCFFPLEYWRSFRPKTPDATLPPPTPAPARG
ncbi:MAG TPA: cytochrome c biogenesis protein CcsA [Methylomirabilota bacterium]|nr:cytochrome c biogenesis protein CcsA [Methylomirabilota bacterium]